MLDLVLPANQRSQEGSLKKCRSHDVAPGPVVYMRVAPDFYCIFRSCLADVGLRQIRSEGNFEKKIR